MKFPLIPMRHACLATLLCLAANAAWPQRAPSVLRQYYEVDAFGQQFLSMAVDGGGTNATVFFQVSVAPSTAITELGRQAIPACGVAEFVSVPVPLQPGSNYTWRAVVTNALGRFEGPVQYLTVPALPTGSGLGGGMNW